MFLYECCQLGKLKPFMQSPPLILDFIFVNHKGIIVAIRRILPRIYLYLNGPLMSEGVLTHGNY